MDWLSKPRTWIVIGVSVVGLCLLYQLWVWEVERVEVKPDTFLVQINLWGKDLPEGEILAPDASYKGIQRDVLSEGRHFLNPLLYTYQRKEMVNVPAGQCAILTRKAGKEIDDQRLARGDYLAEDGERGVVRQVLLPGKHRLNPYEYDYTLETAVEIRSNQVGVRVLKYGADPSDIKGKRDSVYVVPPGYRGVQMQPVSPGTYYLNRYVEALVPVDIKSHPVELRDIQFPSRDGFTIQPHVLVSYKVNPKMAPVLFVMLCDDGKLPQEDTTPEQQKKNPILQKFVLPLIRGFVRIEGSKYDARDYVSQQRVEGDGPAKANPRERLQKELMEKVAPQCEKVGVLIESITVTQPDMNDDLRLLAEQISEREGTRLVRETNKQLVLQYKAQQEQKARDVLVEQKSKMVDAKRDLAVATKLAKQLKEVEQAKLENDLLNAQTELEAAREQAEAMLTGGKADADIILAKNKAEVAGLETAIKGFSSPDQFAQYHVLTRLAPALSEIFASDTSEFARVFSTYMTPSTRKVGLAPVGSAPGGPAANSTAVAGKPNPSPVK